MVQRWEPLLRLGADHAQGDDEGKVGVAHDGSAHHAGPRVLGQQIWDINCKEMYMKG